VLLAHVLRVSPGDIVLGNVDVSERAAEAFERAIARRTSREPLAYITGEKEFWSLSFAVGPGALVSRPETETVIEAAQKIFPDTNAPLRILDLGTGTGILLLTLLHLYPRASGIGTDASADALRWARANAARLNLESRAGLKQGHWDNGIDGRFDLVVSNPPYVMRGALAQLAPELSFEPREALDGGVDGLDAYRALAPVLARRLSPAGCVLLEIGADQGRAAPALFEAAGFAIANVVNDLAGHPRVLTFGPGPKKALETGR
jgi:release factor glutamine methyltransferase